MSQQRARSDRASNQGSRQTRRASVLAAAALAGLVGSANAVDLTWVGAPGVPAPYETAANWSPAQTPTTGDNALVNNGGVAQISAAGGAAGFLYIGTGGGTGSVQQNDGALDIFDDIQVGGQNFPAAGASGGTGTYTLNGGTVTTGFDLTVGAGPGGNGNFVMSGGTATVKGRFGMAYSDNATGTGVQTGGTLAITGNFWMSEGNVNATSSYTLNGATAAITAGDIGIGTHGTASFTLDNGSVTSRSHIRVGDNANYPSNSWRSTGTLTINGGSMSNDGAGGNHILLGHIGRGTINMNGGTLTTDRFNLGQHGANVYPAANTTDHSQGILNQTGGTVTVDTAMVVGEVSLNDNQVNISGGNLVLRNATSNNVSMILGSSGGRGTLNASNAANVAIDSHIFAGSGATAIGAYNISGGNVELGKNIRFAPQAGVTDDPRANLLSGGFLVIGEFGQGTATISGGNTDLDFVQQGRRNNGTSRGQTTQTGGTVVVGRSLAVGGLSPNNNFYEISGGTINLTGVVVEPDDTPPIPAGFTGDQAAWDTAWRNAKNMNELQPGLHVARNSTGDPAVGPIVPSSGRLTISGTAAVNIAGGLYNSTGNLAQTAPGGVGLIEMNGGTLTAASFLNGSASNPGTLASANYVQSGGAASLGHVTGSGNMSVSGGTTNVKSLRQATVALTGTANVVVAPDMSSAGTSRVASISTADSSKLDLGANKLLTDGPVGTWDGTKYTGLQGEVGKAYSFGAWDQPGIYTSQPDAGPAVGKATIGVATGEQALFLAPGETGVFSGQTISSTTAIAMYTWAGDVDLNGYVDAVDYGTIDQWIQFPGTTGYTNGDLNYDGVIDAVDYGIIDNGIQLQGAPIPTNGAVAGAASLSGVTAVPEPTSLSVVALAAAGLMRRRRGRRSSS